MNLYLTENNQPTETLDYTLDYYGISLDEFKAMTDEQVVAMGKRFNAVLDDGKEHEVSFRTSRKMVNYPLPGAKSIEEEGHLGYSDSGSFSRYFDLDKWFSERIKQLPKSVQKTFPFLVCAKASKSEKNRGCEGLPEKEYKQGNIIRQVAWCNKCNHLISPKQKIKGNCQCDIPELFYKQVEIQPIKNNHPTCKPLKLMSYLIILGSREGDIVLDPFVGSGTTALACKLSGRRCIGIEISEEYCEIARSRCNQQVLI